MDKKENARPNAATLRQANGTNMQSSIIAPESNYTTSTDFVASHLGHGSENAISAARLAAILGLEQNTRLLRSAVDKERRNGCVILSDEHGYYLPSESAEQAQEELSSYLHKVDARLITNRKTSIAARQAKQELDILLSGQAMLDEV